MTKTAAERLYKKTGVDPSMVFLLVWKHRCVGLDLVSVVL